MDPSLANPDVGYIAPPFPGMLDSYILQAVVFNRDMTMQVATNAIEVRYGHDVENSN